MSYIGSCTSEINKNNINIAANIIDDEWYWYPTFENYAPNGMPDFDQKQNNWKDPVYQGWTFCGAVSVANIFWYLDSFHSNQIGYPGDGADIFPLVLNNHAQGEPNPGPITDDHNFNNVNDLTSSWDHQNQIFGNELIERIAWYVDTNGCRTGGEIWGTPLYSMSLGVSNWLEDVGLSSYFNIETAFPIQNNFKKSNTIINPLVSYEMFGNTQGTLFYNSNFLNNKISVSQTDLSFHIIASIINNGSFVVLGINGYDEEKNSYFSHWVTVAGVSISESLIALSDPYFDRINPTNDYTLHNDASFVSHDIYRVNTTSPFPEDANYWWLEEYLTDLYSVVPAALIITPLTEIIPEISPISFFIKPEENYLYINDKYIAQTIFGNTIIIGDICFEVNGFSEEGIDKIEFYVNDELKFTDDIFPYEWLWDNPAFGLYTIKIKAIDNEEFIAENEMRVWKFL
jgi:hypothetical protein